MKDKERVQTLHFISGLPRSGSTLLAGLLRQNPRFHAGIISPMGPIYMALQEATSAKSETAVFVSPAQKERLLRAAFAAFYEDLGPDHVIFDTSRLWCAKLSGLARLFPDARLICCVRHVPWIMDSFERLVRRNAFDLSGIFSFEKSNTVYGRLDGLSKEGGTVGFAWNALKEAYYGEHADRLILLRYESLAESPGDTLRKLYTLLGQPWFAHDFDNVTFDAGDFDARLGTPGLHDVRGKVRREERTTILPPDLFRKYESDTFWADPKLNLRKVVVL